MPVLGSIRRVSTIFAVAIGSLSFFLPIISMQVPIFGRIQFSPLNIVSRVFSNSSDKGPSFADASKIGRSVSDHSDSGGPDSKTNAQPGESLPLGIRLLPFVPVEIALSYASLLIITLVVVVRPLLNRVRVLAVTGLLFSGVALISVFLFSNAVMSSLMESLNTPDMRDNPFAGLGQAFAQSIHIDPGLGIYLLVSSMAIITLLCYLSGLDRFEIRSVPDGGLPTKTADSGTI